MRVSVAVVGAALVSLGLAGSPEQADAAPVLAVSAVQTAAPATAGGRTITVTGYAVCTSHERISIPAPVACSSVELSTSDGYSDSVTPTESVSPTDKGKFMFQSVPIPGRTDMNSITYRMTAVRGSGLSSDAQGSCEHSGSIQGITFQFDTLNLFNPIDRGPWTLANQCNPS